MKTLVPSYYTKFKCIKGKCQHSCCRNWEIDIDKNTLEYYKILPTKLGERIRENLTQSSDGNFTCFKNRDDGRCPFLNDKGLCDIICELGDESICQICTDHPRFRNFRSNVVEMGIGLSCEASARIILSHKGKVKLVESDEISIERGKRQSKIDKEINSIREEYINGIFSSEDSFKILISMDTPISVEEYLRLLTSLEFLDANWNNTVKTTKVDIDVPQKLINEYRQLFTYFVYRYLSKSTNYPSEYLKYIDTYINFTILSLLTINSICTSKYGIDYTFDNLLEVSRDYSEEIEYSEDNMSKIISTLIECTTKQY